MTPTQLLYLTNNETKYEGSIVIRNFKTDEGREVLVLDKTIFYPQGGGQQYDAGTISTVFGDIFEVEEVRFVDGEIFHIGKTTSGEIAEGSTLTLFVDSERRHINSKLQSGGHLIDMALRNLGYKELTPLKGFHFPEGPYVEYIGNIDGEQIVTKLQAELSRMTEIGYGVKTQMSNIEEAKSLCYFFPPNMPSNKPIRIVAVWNDMYIPCGGTHVKNVVELKGITIRGVKSKKGNTRVSYTYE